MRIVGEQQNATITPKGTPQAILEKMNTELQAGMKSNEAIGHLVPSGIEPASGPLAQFVSFIAGERERLGRVAKNAGMTAEWTRTR